MKTNWKENPYFAPTAWALLLLGALFLRLFGLHHESLWWDEYASHVYLDASSLREFLSLNRTLDPMALPVYNTLEYFWNRHVSESVYLLRLLSVILGLAALPLAYALGRTLHSRQAGYTAAALLALSPVHIHHSQGIRMYVLFILVAACVVWSFVRLLEKPSPGLWFLHLAASLCLYWTHAFAGLIPAVLGGFLLLRYRRRMGLFWCWTLLQVALFTPTVLYLASVRFWPEDTTHSWIGRPSLGALVADLFFDDISTFHWQFRLSNLAQHLFMARLFLDFLFAALILAFLAYLAVYCLRSIRKPVNAAFPELTLLMVLWLLLPPLFLFGLSWLIRPCMFPRYTAHCILPLYVLLGTAAALPKRAFLRRLLPVLLVGGMALQWFWLQPGPQRTDWRSAGLLLHEQATEKDIVLVESFLWRDVFKHNLERLTPGMLPIPIAAAEERPLLAAQAVLCAGMLSKLTSSDDNAHVWVIIAMDYFEPGPPKSFETLMQHWDIPFDRRSFPAIRELYVYKLGIPDKPLPDTPGTLLSAWPRELDDAGWVGEELDHHAMQAFSDLATELALHGHSPMALNILDDLFFQSSFAKQLYDNLYNAIQTETDVDNCARAVRKIWDGYGFRDNGRNEFACAAFENAVALDKRHALAFFELGMERLALGRHAAAAEAFAHAAALNDQFRMLDNLIQALKSGVNIAEAARAVQAYRQGILEQSRGNYDAAVHWLRQAVNADPLLSDAHTSQVFVLIVQRKLEEAQAALDQYFALFDAPSPGAFGLQSVVHIARNALDAARASAEEAFKRDDAYEAQFGPFFRALLWEGDYDKTIAAMDRLKEQGVNLYPLLHEYVLKLLQHLKD